MGIEVVAYSHRWPEQFRHLAAELETVLAGVPVLSIEHVGSTAVPGLVAKPVIDVDIIVAPDGVSAALKALETAGYVHRGDLGLKDREALSPPQDGLSRNVYVCVEGTLHVRNHLAARDALRADPELRERYGAVKLALAGDPGMDIDRYLAGKSAVLQEILAASCLTAAERQEIYVLNTGAGTAGPRPPHSE